jgi:hypothetical protein
MASGIISSNSSFPNEYFNEISQKEIRLTYMVFPGLSIRDFTLEDNFQLSKIAHKKT